MAEQKLAMSLDALISESQQKKGPREPRKPRREEKSGPRKGLQANKGAAAANGSQPKPQRQKGQPQQVQMQQQAQQQAPRRQNNRGAGTNLGVRGGKVQKQQILEVPVSLVRGGPVGGPRRPAPFAQRQQPAAPFMQRQAAPEGKWQHDMFREEYAPARRAPVSQVQPLQPKLIIKNLHHNVSEDDVLELFSTCGTVASHALNYDSSGRSLGTGWVVFQSRGEAVAAKSQYNGVLLDGKAMEIFLAEEAGATTIKQLSSGIRVTKPAGGAASGSGRMGPAGGMGGGMGMGGGGGGQRLAAAALRDTAPSARPARGAPPLRAGRGGRLRSAVVPQSTLDRELDDYMHE